MLKLYKPDLKENFDLNAHWNRNTGIIEDFAKSVLSKSISKVELKKHVDFVPTQIAFYKGSNLYIMSTLSSVVDSKYTKCTVHVYDDAGSVVVDTIVITIGYTGDDVTSVTYSKQIALDMMSILDIHGVLAGGEAKIKAGTIGMEQLSDEVKTYFAKKTDLNSKIIIGTGEDIPVSGRVKGKMYFKVTDVQSSSGGDGIRVSPNMGIKYE